MKTSISLLSALLLLGSGSVLAQQPGQEQPGAQQPGQQQPGQQPGQQQPGQQQPGQQPGAQQPGQPQPGQPQPGLETERDRDTDIAAADRPRGAGEALERREQGQIRSDELVGSDVMDQQDENVGSVDELLIEEDGQIAALLINVGGVVGVGGRTVALPWDSVEIQREEEDGAFQDRYTIRTQMSRQELEDAPEFQDDQQEEGAFRN